MGTRRLCMILLFGWMGISLLQAQTFDKLWKQVEQAQQDNLPQTVIQLTDEICRKGEKEKNFTQLLKARMLQMKYREVLNPENFYVNLKSLEQWVRQAEDPIEKAILHSLIAEQYTDYARNHLWELPNRAMLTGEVSSDIREWALNQFVDVIKTHIHEALVDSTLLLTASSSEYAPFIVCGETSRYYHHDMYHLLLSRAISDLKRMSLFFDSSEKDIKSEIDHLYKQMLAAYQVKGKDKGAYLLTYLEYLEWEGGIKSSHWYHYAKRKDIKLVKDYYQEELDSLKTVYQSTDACAEVYLAMAKYAVTKEQPLVALQICDEAIRKYPHYRRIDPIKNIREEIVNPRLSVMPEKGSTYPGSEVVLKVFHKNVKGFKLQFYQSDKLSFEKYYSLPIPENYEYRTTTLAPFKVPRLGIYTVHVIPDNCEKDHPAQVQREKLCVTHFKVLTSLLPDEKMEVLTLDAQTGHPIPDSQVIFYNDSSEVVREITTDAQGKFILPMQKEYRYLKALKGEDAAMEKQSLSYYWNDYKANRRSSEEIILLTDRSIYRPGQTVHVKGIAYNQGSDSVHVASGKEYTLLLLDANADEIRKVTVKTNDFGSFIADFILPSVCLNGHFMLKVEGERSTTEILVEDFKRPSFDITFEERRGSYQMGDTVRVKGHAQAFNGAVMPNLSVKYTVKRFIYNWGWMVNYSTITDGTVRSDENGSFVIPVHLEKYIDFEKERRTSIAYRFQVEAIVTNAAGETQSSVHAIVAGKYSLLVNVDLPKKVNKDQPVNMIFKVDNFSNQPVEVTGKYRLFRLKSYEDSKEAPVEDSLILTETFVSNKEQKLNWQSLPSGAYLMKVSVKDYLGREAEIEARTILFSLQDKRPPVSVRTWVYEENTQFDATHPAVFYLGTSEKDAYVMLKTRCGNRLLEDKILNLSDTIMRFEYPYYDYYDSGISVNFCFLKDFQVNEEHIELTKRLPERKLVMKWNVFRNKLTPGQREEWNLTISTPQGQPADAEMLALMYDASLDKIWKRKQDFHLVYEKRLPLFKWDYGWWGYHSWAYSWNHKFFPEYLFSYDYFVTNLLKESYQRQARGHFMFEGYALGVKNKDAERKTEKEIVFDMVGPTMMPLSHTSKYVKNEGKQQLEDAPAGLRTNLSETAFFYPQLRTNEKGEIVFSFTMPESLTRWNFCGYSHTKDMITGMLESEATTSKEFMLTPNLPRFIRVGDHTSVAASIVNMTGKIQKGIVTFTLFDPMTEKVISAQKQIFAVEAGETIGVNFMFQADDGQDVLGCRMIADSGQFSDGEQQILPVLSDKEYVTETLPMPIRGKEERIFSLGDLFNHHSKTATDRSLTIEYTANPAWYAIQALPSLGTPEDDNAISWVTAYYANSLASFIMNSQPRIKMIVDSWQLNGGTKETFLSNLQRNQEVKNILLSESPWLLESKTEQQQRERIATLFDLNNIRGSNMTALTRLNDLQNTGGSWSWYKGMGPSFFLSLYIAELNARLVLLTGEKPIGKALEMQKKTFTYLHQTVLGLYNGLSKSHREAALTAPASILHYLYLIAITGEKVPDANKEAYDFYLSKVKDLPYAAPMKLKAYAAIILDKAGHKKAAQGFVAFLKQYLTQTNEQGMFFAFNENPYSWGEMQMQAHVNVMEALKLIGGNDETVEEMKLWLLKQKQTQQWNSPVATADAVYALLMKDANLLDNQGDVKITIAGNSLTTSSAAQGATSGLGYIKHSYSEKKVVNASTIKVEKKTPGIAWGAVYAQYKSPISDVKQQGGELNVQKRLYVERIVNNQPQLEPITDKTILEVGDKVISRLSIRLDRPMDFVQLKDQRGACFEPIGSISGYRWDNRFGYYVDIKDASTNFFFDHLGKGVYVLEYSYRVSRSGTYETGLATMQSAYAPEYASHSASSKVIVQ